MAMTPEGSPCVSGCDSCHGHHLSALRIPELHACVHALSWPELIHGASQAVRAPDLQNWLGACTSELYLEVLTQGSFREAVARHEERQLMVHSWRSQLGFV